MVNLEAEKAELAPSPEPITARSAPLDLPPRYLSFGQSTFLFYFSLLPLSLAWWQVLSERLLR